MGAFQNKAAEERSKDALQETHFKLMDGSYISSKQCRQDKYLNCLPSFLIYSFYLFNWLSILLPGSTWWITDESQLIFFSSEELLKVSLPENLQYFLPLITIVCKIFMSFHVQTLSVSVCDFNHLTTVILLNNLNLNQTIFLHFYLCDRNSVLEIAELAEV